MNLLYKSHSHLYSNALSPFILCLKGSTVNMNIMGWVYSKVVNLVGSPGHTALGASLMIGKVVGLKLPRVKHEDSGYRCFIFVSDRDTRSFFL